MTELILTKWLTMLGLGRMDTGLAHGELERYFSDQEYRETRVNRTTAPLNLETDAWRCSIAVSVPAKVLSRSRVQGGGAALESWIDSLHVPPTWRVSECTVGIS